MKQYFLTKAYTGNTHVVRCIDGKIKDDQILADYELGGYLSALENMGYTQGYYVPEYFRIMEEREALYMNACSDFRAAAKHPIELSDEDAKRYFPLCDYVK